MPQALMALFTMVLLMFSGVSAAHAGSETLPEDAVPQHEAIAPDKTRSIRYVENDENLALFEADFIAGDTLALSEDAIKITWRDKYGAEVVNLDATNNGKTPAQFFNVDDNQIQILSVSTRSACVKSYVGAATFGLAWAGGVCGPLHAIPAAGLAYDAVTILGAPVVNWDSVCWNDRVT